MKNRLLFLFLIVFITSCSENYLDVKSNKALIVPHTLADLESVLNNNSIMNTSPGVGVLSVDDWFFTDNGWNALTGVPEKNGYRWDADVLQGMRTYAEWSAPYKQIFYANTVLDILPAIDKTAANEIQWNGIKGRALFHRAFSHYQLAQVFCLPYVKGGEDHLGIPLRTSADLNVPVYRSSVNETYEQVLADLAEAADLLPAKALNAQSPSQAAAKAMLAKVYLTMQNYVLAEKYAGEALQLQPTLMNYNTLDANAARPIPRFNAEVLFEEISGYYQFSSSTLAYIDTLLYATYAANDLRKTVFFRNRLPRRYTFKATYTGNVALFTGLATDEVYLTRAECRARLGNTSGAVQDLNTLLITRYKTGTFVPITETNAEALLKIILLERQKQLVFRPERWTDMRRLNLDPRFARTMSRRLLGQTYTLPAGSQRYVYALPPNEIMYSELEQNPREN